MNSALKHPDFGRTVTKVCLFSHACSWTRSRQSPYKLLLARLLDFHVSWVPVCTVQPFVLEAIRFCSAIGEWEHLDANLSLCRLGGL